MSHSKDFTKSVPQRGPLFFEWSADYSSGSERGCPLPLLEPFLKELPMSNRNTDSLEPTQGGGITVLITATTVEQTGMLPGRWYRFAACDGSAAVEWGADNATVADAGYAFAVPRGAIIDQQCPTGITAINVIEVNTASDAAAALCISLLRDKA